jgi:hypothetical protein
VNLTSRTSPVTRVAELIDDTDPRDAARGMGWIRVVIGAVLLAAPAVFARAFATPLRTDTATAVRAAAVRDLAVGAGTLRALSAEAEDPEVRRWIDAGVAMDAVDFLSLLRARGMRPLSRLLGLGAAAGGTGLGVLVRQRLRA